MSISPEEAIQAIRWKLNISSSPEHADTHRRNWELLQSDPAVKDELGRCLMQEFGKFFAKAVRSQLQSSRSPDDDLHRSLWEMFRVWVEQNRASTKVAGILGEAVQQVQNRSTVIRAGSRRPPTPNPPPLPRPSPPPVVTPPPPPVIDSILDPEPSAVAIAPRWNYLPPPNRPEPHTEFATRSEMHPSNGLRLIGARVRGKKHKHEGTNCDDWFEFAHVGPWTIIAVSDGAGSKTLSRIGAKASCEAAIQELSADLGSMSIARRASLQAWASDCQRTEPYLNFMGRDLNELQESLIKAMQRALERVRHEADLRRNSQEYLKLLGRPPEVNDFPATLLLAVHIPIEIDGKASSLVMAVQVGDGMTGAIHGSTGKFHILGVADSGGYSGETEFITSSGKCERDALLKRIQLFLGPVQALLVMTDGVSDDYFPNDPALQKLWADLVLNGIPDLCGCDEARMAEALKSTQIPTLAEVLKADFQTPGSLIDSEGSREIPIRSIIPFAEKLGLSPEQVAANPALLWAGAYPGTLLPGTAEERLRLWLDSYQVRGSFDDRTLVVLHREYLP